MCNELFHNDNVIVKHDLIYYLFFLLCVGSFEVKYIICVNVLFIYIRKKQRERNYTYEKFMFCFKVRHLSI